MKSSLKLQLITCGVDHGCIKITGYSVGGGLPFIPLAHEAKMARPASDKLPGSSASIGPIEQAH